MQHECRMHNCTTWVHYCYGVHYCSVARSHECTVGCTTMDSTMAAYCQVGDVVAGTAAALASPRFVKLNWLQSSPHAPPPPLRLHLTSTFTLTSILTLALTLIFAPTLSRARARTRCVFARYWVR